MKIVVKPLNVYGVNCSSCIENFHSLGFCASEIQIFFPSYTGYNGAVSSAGISYSITSVFIFANAGLILTSNNTLSFAFSVRCASNSICQIPAKLNVGSAEYLVKTSCPVIWFSVTSAAIGAILLSGFETLTFTVEISASGWSSSPETITLIWFGPIPTGSIVTSNLAFSENNEASYPLIPCSALTDWISPAGRDEFTNNATTASSAIPSPASNLNGFFNFLKIAVDFKSFLACWVNLIW